MARRGIVRAVTGLAAGALLTAGLLGVLEVGALARAPFVPFTIFDWLIRVLPGRVVTFGLDLTLRVLEGLGFDIKDTAKTAEQVLAIASLFAAGLVIALLFFVLVRTANARRIQWYGLAAGGVVGVFSLTITLIQAPSAGVAGKAGAAVWVLALFLLWGWGISRLYLLTFPVPRGSPVMAAPKPERIEAPAGGEGAAAPTEAWAGAVDASGPLNEAPAPSVDASAAPTEGAPAEAEVRAISRRRFLVQMGGLAATIVVVGAGVGDILRAETSPSGPGPLTTPVTFPNASSPVEPVPGTRPEYTPVADHYRVDIDLTSPEVDVSTWRLNVEGLVARQLSLTLGQLKSGYRAMEEFVTLSCISNPLGGPLIGTTLWTGASLREVLADAAPSSDARYVRITSADGFSEEVALDLVQSDPRILLTYAWDGQPLPRQHGFPLRILIPDRYGMKQPKWITAFTLTAESKPGYWVERGWDAEARVKTTSVIDTVAVKSPLVIDGRSFIPIGGIAYSGAKGISKVEIQIDDGPWQAAQLRRPLSGLTWVIWRYDWPFTQGDHRLTVRAYDGQGQPQATQEVPPDPSAATGLYSEMRTIPPLRSTSVPTS
jgi:DMSO/TMAO reductase YedYZ molybdopterin-dependent catalytic subunit